MVSGFTSATEPGAMRAEQDMPFMTNGTAAKPRKPTSESDRVHTIDGLRGVAATLVVLFHLHGAISRSATDWLWSPIDWIARNGFLGVDIFFVISGFVI